MKTKNQLLTLFFVLVLAISVYAKEKPNILFFYADDWGRIASIYDDNRLGGICDVVKTPTFDKIAENGVLFTNAFFPCPQCTPCRASIATGSYFWRTGKTAFLNQRDGFDGYDAGNEFTGFGQALIDEGYFVGTSGKAMEKRWTKAKPVPGEKGGYRYSLTIYKGKNQHAKDSIREELVKGYRATIQNLLKQSGDQPFYFVFGSICCHRPWIRGSGKELWGINPDDLKGKLPAFLPDVPDIREDMADYFGEIHAIDLMLQTFMEELNKVGELENTVIIVTGDNGPPGFTHGKTNLYDFGIAAPLMISGPVVNKPGRVVSDFINLMDLSPTFIDIAGGEKPEEMDGNSIYPLLISDKEGRIDKNRNYVAVGRERHVHNARPGNLSYPSRAIRTDEYTFIYNPHNERWVQGDPYQAAKEKDSQKLYNLGLKGLSVFKDIDASPTKAWNMSKRDDVQNEKFWHWMFGQRPELELYQISDTYQITNLVDQKDYKKDLRDLSKTLKKIRKQTADPRLKDIFDNPPWTSPE